MCMNIEATQSAAHAELFSTVLPTGEISSAMIDPSSRLAFVAGHIDADRFTTEVAALIELSTACGALPAGFGSAALEAGLFVLHSQVEVRGLTAKGELDLTWVVEADDSAATPVTIGLLMAVAHGSD